MLGLGRHRRQRVNWERYNSSSRRSFFTRSLLSFFTQHIGLSPVLHREKVRLGVESSVGDRVVVVFGLGVTHFRCNRIRCVFATKDLCVAHDILRFCAIAVI